MKPGFLRTASIALAFVLGGLLPLAHVMAWMIRWLIMGMLFAVFLQTRLSRKAVRKSHGGLLVANIAMGFVGWMSGYWLGGRDVGLAGFFCGITPTATAAPVIVGFLNGNVEYVIAAFLVINVVVAALLPLLMPLVLGQTTPELFLDLLGSVGLVVFVPMSVAWLVRTLYPDASRWPKKLANVSFGAWVLVLFLITARVSDFMHTHADLPRMRLFQIAVLSILICAVNFVLGRFIGGKTFAREASQSLGQKNNTITIYLALAYANPLAALGPTFYVLWHNLWNSWQLHRAASVSTGKAELNHRGTESSEQKSERTSAYPRG